jgi:hypothetical protein
MAVGNDSLPAGWVIAGSIALVLLVGTIIWFAIPDLSANHKFTSPSGRVSLEIGEFCEEKCNRSIVAETESNAGKVRRGCTFDLPQTHAVLLNAYPLWAEDERSVEIVYADAEGQGGKFALDIARDCTLTE